MLWVEIPVLDEEGNLTEDGLNVGNLLNEVVNESPTTYPAALDPDRFDDEESEWYDELPGYRYEAMMWEKEKHDERINEDRKLGFRDW